MKIGAWLCVWLLMVFVRPPVQAQESPEQWRRDGRTAVAKARQLTPITTKARNVILFIGDGMGVSTITAARILEGQQHGQTGEENRLSFETLPYTALIKTYNTNQQTPDSAGTMTAIVTGVKTKAGVLSVNQNVITSDHTSVKGNSLTTILELAERAGLSTGVVTTTTVTHATPAACYAHSPQRRWENDSQLPPKALEDRFPDIARQLIEFSIGDGLEVVLGGGRRHFLPDTEKDPEAADQTGMRKDGRNLAGEWLRNPQSAYVWNRSQFNEIDAAKTDHLLGLFAPSNLTFEHDRNEGETSQPSLSEMTQKALAILSKNKKGFFLMVEGGRIDHAHHGGSAYHALTEVIEFSNAVRVAMNSTNRRETLIIVTADHSHVFTFGADATRGNPVLGKVVKNDPVTGTPIKGYALDKLGLPYTAVGYANGPGYAKTAKGRPDLNSIDTADHHYRPESAVPLTFESHGGEDVPLYADGPHAYLFHGLLEQNVIFHVMVEALELAD